MGIVKRMPQLSNRRFRSEQPWAYAIVALYGQESRIGDSDRALFNAVSQS